MLKIRKGLIVFLALGLSVSYGQDLKESLRRLLKDNATSYVQPVGDALGTNLNTNWFHRGNLHHFLGFDVGVKLSLVMIPDSVKTFNFNLGDQQMAFALNPITGTNDTIMLSYSDIYYGSNTEMPTIASDESRTMAANPSHITDVLVDSLNARGLPGENFRAAIANAAAEIPDFTLKGLGLASVPFGVPQVSVGLPGGMEVTARFLPKLNLPKIGDKLGKVDLLGLGVRMSLDQYIPIPMFPFTINLYGNYQKIGIGDVLTAKSTSYGVQVGKSINLLVIAFGVYANAGFETSSFDLDYTYQRGDVEVPVKLSLDGPSGTDMGAGVWFRIVPLTYISVGVTKSPTSTAYTAGIGLSLR